MLCFHLVLDEFFLIHFPINFQLFNKNFKKEMLQFHKPVNNLQFRVCSCANFGCITFFNRIFLKKYEKNISASLQFKKNSIIIVRLRVFSPINEELRNVATDYQFITFIKYTREIFSKHFLNLQCITLQKF